MTLDITAFGKLYATPTAAASVTSTQQSDAFKESGLVDAIHSIARGRGTDRKKPDASSHIMDDYAYTDAKSGLTFESVRANYSLGDEYMHDVRVIDRNGERIFDGRHCQLDPSFTEDGEEYTWDVNKVNVPALREVLPVFAALGIDVKTATVMDMQRHRSGASAAKPA